jgi:hypothetical protein
MKVSELVLRADLPRGRRGLRLRAGSMTIVAVEVPASSMTEPEWRDVQSARRSYAAVWGGAMREDPFDGLGNHARIWDVRHYLAWVRDAVSGDGAKLVTARKVAVRASALTAAQRVEPGELLPLDIQFWRMRREPLWQSLRAHLRSRRPGDARAAFRFATVGRFATHPVGERERERTAAGWAAIQVLATYRDPSLLHLRTVRPDFADRVLAVRTVDGATIAPVFPQVEDALGFSPGSVELDAGLPVVQRHQVAAPGYFVHGDEAAAALASLLRRGLVTISDLHGAISRLVAGGGRRIPLAADADPDALARLLTRPRSFKHLVPLLSGVEPLSRLPVEEFRRHVVHRPRAVPFCSAAPPAVWATNAWAILDAVTRRRSATRLREEP